MVDQVIAQRRVSRYVWVDLLIAQCYQSFPSVLFNLFPPPPEWGVVEYDGMRDKGVLESVCPTLFGLPLNRLLWLLMMVCRGDFQCFWLIARNITQLAQTISKHTNQSNSHWQPHHTNSLTPWVCQLSHWQFLPSFLCLFLNDVPSLRLVIG